MANLFNKTKLALAFFVTIALFSLNFNQSGNVVRADVAPAKFEQSATIEAKPIDNRAKILQDYLSLKNSPMQNNAQDFIDAADKYGVDWKLVPAIAGVESTFGQATPGGFFNPSYNAWGWGVYGTQAIYFKSWKDGIYTLNQGLREKYLDKGLTNPYQMNSSYAASGAWGGHVDYFLKDLDAYAKQYQTAQTTPNLNVIIVNRPQLAVK
jgi:hypothetical protein